MIIEFFGLSNTGKSYLKKKLKEEGNEVVAFEEYSKILKILQFIKYFLKYPLNTIRLFSILNNNGIFVKNLSLQKRLKAKLMRNSYLFSVLAKSEVLIKRKNRVFVDEFSLQSVFMILQSRSSEAAISHVLSFLPKSDVIFIFESDRKKRHKQYEKLHPKIPGATLLPTSWISHEYASIFMKSMEYNFKIIKKIISKNSIRDRREFSKLKIKLADSYKKENNISIYKNYKGHSYKSL